VFEVLQILADRVAAKYQKGLATTDFPDPLDETSTVRATPIDRVYETGFDPLQGGFRVGVEEDFQIFDQWVEILPTDQVVAVEVTSTRRPAGNCRQRPGPPTPGCVTICVTTGMRGGGYRRTLADDSCR